jgi:hypothetical protein
VVAGAALVASRLVPLDWRPPLASATVLAFVVQGPLGWWLVRSIGTPRFFVVWGIGFAARLVLLGVMALVVAPALGWAAPAALVPLALLLVASIGVEVGALVGGSGAALR